LNPNTEVGGTAFAAIIGSTSRRAILDSINWIQPLRSPTSCAAKHGTAYGPSNFGIRVEPQDEATTQLSGSLIKSICQPIIRPSADFAATTCSKVPREPSNEDSISNCAAT
jgi:hypothetical protein